MIDLHRKGFLSFELRGAQLRVSFLNSSMENMQSFNNSLGGFLTAHSIWQWALKPTILYWNFILLFKILNLKTTFKANIWDLLSNINTNHFNVMQSKAPLKYLTTVCSTVIIYYCFPSSPVSNYFIFNTVNDKRGQIIHSEMLTKISNGRKKQNE